MGIMGDLVKEMIKGYKSSNRLYEGMLESTKIADENGMSRDERGALMLEVYRENKEKGFISGTTQLTGLALRVAYYSVKKK